MTLDQEYAKYAGQSVLVPGAAADDRGQCVQWACYVLHDVYGQPYVWADAIDWWNKFDSLPQLKNNFDRITDDTVKKGDFIIWNQKVGSIYGHIDVAMADGNINNFVAADTNWAGNLTVHEVAHIGQAGYIIGIIRRKGAVVADKITRAQEQVISIMQTGALPGKNYNYRFTGLPLTQANLDAMLNFWKQIPRPTVSGGVYTPYNGPQLYTKKG